MAPEPKRQPSGPEPVAKTEGSQAKTESITQDLSTTADEIAAEAFGNDKRSVSRTQIDIGVPSARNSEEKSTETKSPHGPSAVHSVLSRRSRAVIISLVAFAGVFSPMTSSIYLPALPSIAKDLKVKTSYINLSITTYQIFQGLAPSFIASFSDNHGRRPAYIVTFSIYLVANLALALQNSYPALMVLRCLQSAGSSATIALGSATVSDLVTRAERGRWLGYTTLGISLGPALGPVIGGLLSEHLGWHSIFWFLFIASGIVAALMICILPETGRAVVGNNSVPPKKWNYSLLQWWRIKRGRPFNGGHDVEEDRLTIQRPRQRVNPLSSLLILFEREGGITLGFGAIFFSGYFMVMTTLSEQLTERFGFSSVVTGLCYLPLGLGSLLSRWSTGKLLDLNFRRHARLMGHKLDLDRQQAIEIFPIERIRLEVCLPMVYISCGTVLAYAWTMETRSSLAGIEVSLFFLGLFFSGVQQGLNTLVVDTHADIPATATAANNLFRCLVSAGGTAVAPFMITKIGVGYMGVFISAVWLCFSPLLWLVMLRGKTWRDEEKAKQRKQEARSALNTGGQAV